MPLRVPTLPFEETQPVSPAEAPQGIERRFDISFVARLAHKEKQIQQVVRPVIAVHKWFARRPGTLFRALLLAEFGEGPLREAYYRPHRLSGLRVADPFMGGGTPLLEANRLGCEIVGWDVNPMAYWIVRQEIGDLDLAAYTDAAQTVESRLAEEIGRHYRTSCLECGSLDASVKYFLWVKTRDCRSCGQSMDLFPGYLVAAAERHPRNVVLCSACGHLNEREDRHRLGDCDVCSGPLTLAGPARRNRCKCPHCGEVNPYSNPGDPPPSHRQFALEYHCPVCASGRSGRFFKAPDAADLRHYEAAKRRLAATALRFVPDDAIPPGDETARLHRWGYRRFSDLFNARQLLGLEHLAREVVEVSDRRVRAALATNLSDLLRYQNLLCRYDTRSLKSLDVFSVHGFPVGLVACESNFLGIRDRGTLIGSGGFANIVSKYAGAKRYCARPFEIRYGGQRTVRVEMEGEWIGERRLGDVRRIHLACGSATEVELAPGSLDAVLTDPPYLGNVQYAELMDFCYSWLRRLVDDSAFGGGTSKRKGDLTANQTLERGLEHFTEGLSQVFSSMARALKPGAPLVFTYHHNDLEAYHAVAVALLDAGLLCTAVLPCPAEMGGSIHIHGTGSSILDSVFVCRGFAGSGTYQPESADAGEISAMLADERLQLRRAGVEPTAGDMRCLAFGHLTRAAVAELFAAWNPSASWTAKLRRVGSVLSRSVEASFLEGLPGREPR